MLFDKNYVNNVFPDDECEKLFMKCMAHVYKDSDDMGYEGLFFQDNIPDSMKAFMNKGAFGYRDTLYAHSIRTYMSYTVYYCLAIDTDVLSCDLFLECVLNTYDGIYDYDNYGVYATLWFESRELTIEFYKAFYEFLLPILEFYNDNDVNRRSDDINFSYQYKTLYKVYREFGVDVCLDEHVLCDTFVGIVNDVDENYERPRKKTKFFS